MRRIALSTALLLLAACADRAPPLAEPPPPAAGEPPAAPLAPISSLAGEWRVAGIDGQPINEPYGIALSGSEKEIWWSPRCAGYASSYRIDGANFSSGPPLDFVPPRPGEPGPPICLIAPPAKVASVFAAITAGKKIGRTPNNGIEISGGGHSLLLFSQ